MATLGPGTAGFTAWTAAELPAEWKRPVSQEALQHAANAYKVPVAKLVPWTAVELPDYPWAWQYTTWHRARYGENSENKEYLPVMVTARDSFRGEGAAARARMSSDCLRALLETGRPAPLFTRVFAIKPSMENQNMAAGNDAGRSSPCPRAG